MSNKVDPKRVAIFIGVCTALAIIIGGWWELSVRRQQQPQFGIERQAVAPVPQTEGQRPAVATSIAQEQQANQRAEEAAAARATYLARYVNSTSPRQPGMKMVAVAVVSENGAFNFALNAAVASRLKTPSVATPTSFFRPAFVSDGLFANAFAGSNGIFDKLELSKSLDALLLGREQVQYSSDPSLENVTTANMQLEITAFSIADGQSQSWTYVANGAGFKQSEARQMAEERLIKQIANDPKMSLGF
jgi:hypothetical protein